MNANIADKLEHAITAYSGLIKNGDQPFHERIRDDARWTLAKHRGENSTIQPTGHARQTARRALREVYSEICLLQYSHQCRSALKARKLAAAVLSVPYSDYVRVLRSKAP